MWSCQGDSFKTHLLLLHVGGVKVEREQRVGEGSILVYASVVYNSVGLQDSMGFRVRVHLLFMSWRIWVFKCRLPKTISLLLLVLQRNVLRFTRHKSQKMIVVDNLLLPSDPILTPNGQEF